MEIVFFIFAGSVLVFFLVATAKRMIVGKTHPRPWNQDPDDYDSEHGLF